MYSRLSQDSELKQDLKGSLVGDEEAMRGSNDLFGMESSETKSL